MPRDTEDEIREMEWEARQARRANRCQCEPLPMYCPGAAACPYSGYESDDDDEEADDE